MKITKQRIKEIIHEEIAKVSEKGKTLGTHDTRAADEKQATAIRISRNVGEARHVEPNIQALEQRVLKSVRRSGNIDKKAYGDLLKLSKLRKYDMGVIKRKVRAAKCDRDWETSFS